MVDSKCIKSCAVQCKWNYVLIFPFFKWIVTIPSFRKKARVFFSTEPYAGSHVPSITK